VSISAIVRALRDAGATPDIILAAVEAHEATQADALAARRAKDAARQQAKRDRDSHVTSRDVTVTVRDERDEPSLSRPPPPQTPPPPTHTHPDITTHARQAAFAKPNGFARFWEAYPNKVGKAAAEKAYAKACRGFTGPDPPADAILAGVERAKQSRAWIDGYIPHPTTWLNRGSWEDQPSETPIIELRPQNHHVPRPDDKRLAREANLARAFAGSEMAAGRRS